jgi:hypothetical protein
VVSPPEWLVVRDVGTETIVYDRRAHRAHCLGRTAAAVWRTWDGRSETGEIARRIGQVLGEPCDETSVRLALQGLRTAGLADTPDTASDTGRESGDCHGRRAALGRVGIASLAVLSIAVHAPAQVAATCLHNGDPCTRSSQCCSSCCNTSSGRCAGGGNCAPP